MRASTGAYAPRGKASGSKGSGMIEQRTAAYEYLQFAHLAGVPGLTHAIFTRRGGFSAAPYAGLNLSYTTGDDPATVRRNRAIVVAALGMPLVGARPVHGASVVVIERALAGEDAAEGDGAPWQERLQRRLRLIEADAMLTDVPDMALCWAFGDCAPILLFDPEHRALALVHAGWRGTAQAIVPRAIAAMCQRYGTRTKTLLAGLGPAIGACCYEVSDAVRAAFARNPLARKSAVFAERPSADGGSGHYLDITASNRRQLLMAGVLPAHLQESGYCTGCRPDLFYSNRREPKPSGRFAAAIGLRDVRE